jgi:hypothetical protein
MANKPTFYPTFMGLLKNQRRLKSIQKYLNVNLKSIKITNRSRFNWWLAIQYAEKTQDSDFKDQLAHLASDWVTCACGNQCAIIPRHFTGAPEDDVLYEEGKNFYEYVESEDWAKAKETLKKIEERSAEVIAETERGI